jgi:curved DNA-binding protein CbpA
MVTFPNPRLGKTLFRQVARLIAQFDAKADYYKTLGISQTASNDDIKKAYRGLVKKYHPDINKSGEAKFKEINQAHEVLSDPDLRKQYDSVRFPSTPKKPTHQASPRTGFHSDRTRPDPFQGQTYQDPFNSFNQHMHRKSQAPPTSNANGKFRHTSTYTDHRGNTHTFSYYTDSKDSSPFTNHSSRGSSAYDDASRFNEFLNNTWKGFQETSKEFKDQRLRQERARSRAKMEEEAMRHHEYQGHNRENEIAREKMVKTAEEILNTIKDVGEKLSQAGETVRKWGQDFIDSFRQKK